jgi:hypothetical protein
VAAYRLIITLVAPVNPGPPKILKSRSFTVLKAR